MRKLKYFGITAAVMVALSGVGATVAADSASAACIKPYPCPIE